MKLGLSSYTYTWEIGVPGHTPARPLTVDRLVQRALDLDVDVLQIADNLPLHRLRATELDALARYVSSAGLGIEVGTRGIGDDNLARYVDIARRLGSPLVRIVVDAGTHRPDVPEIIATLSRHEDAFRSAGMHLAIENHDRLPVRALAHIVEALGTDWAGICLDTINSFGALEGPDVVVTTLAPFTVNVHVKDFVVARADHKMGFIVEGRPVGQGQLDVPWLLEILANHSRAPTAIVELWTPPCDALDDTIRRETKWAAESVAYLRSLPAFSVN